MSIAPINISTIFDIGEEELEEIEEVVDMDINDDDIDQILDAKDGVGHMWEQKDDDKETSEERIKTYIFPIEEYENWIKNLKKAGLSYVKHDRRCQLGSRRKYQWTEKWYCHRHGAYESVAGKNLDKKPRLAQKETKKCGCKSCINVNLPINSSNVILKHSYKHLNHYPGKLSDLCKLPLSENIRQFVQKRVLEGLDAFSIQKLLRFRAIELQNQIKKECSDHPKDIQNLRDGLITKDDLFIIQ
jgi:hypothetical protein